MKKKLSIVLVAMMLSLFLLPGGSLAQEVVNVFNWYDFIDEKVLEIFEQETGIHVNYMCFTTNEDMMVQVEASPGAFDVVFPSEYCVERLANKGLLAEINYDHIPNMSYILDSLKDPSYDVGNAHSVPYLWGTLGILYNKDMVTTPVDSWSVLSDDTYAGNIFMLDSIRDSLGIALKYLGYSMNSNDYIELRAATDLLLDQKKRGLVKAYQVDETKDKMVAGEAALGVVWSGDAEYAVELNDHLAYAYPSEGTNVWVDCAVIPTTAKNLANAEAFINFLCRPDIAAMNSEAIGYSSPNSGAIELMGDEYISNPIMNPDSEYITAKCEYYCDLDDAWLTVYNTLWQEIKNAR